MGKYASNLTFRQVCDIECEEATEILKHYGVPKSDISEICGMITEGYYHASMGARSGRIMEKMIRESTTLTEEQFIRRYLELSNTEPSLWDSCESDCEDEDSEPPLEVF